MWGRLYVTNKHEGVWGLGFDVRNEHESPVILRKRGPSLREGLPTKDLCIDGRRYRPMPSEFNDKVAGNT
jgi:hypothetical protein